MTEDHDNDEVIDVNPGDAGDDQAGKPEDRGDEVTPSNGGDHEGSETDKAPDGDAATDAAAATTAAEGGAKPGKQPMPEMVPQQRFREVNDALKIERAEKAQLLELLARQTPAAAPAAAEVKPPEPFDVKAKEREYTAALLNGDDEAAVDIRMQINAEITRQADERAAQAEERAFERMNQREQVQVFTAAADAIRSEYPELDEKGANANIKAIEFVVRERDALISDGETPHNALRVASEAAAVRYGFAKASQAAEAAPGNVRQIQSVTRNARAANAQPAALSGVGDRATQAVRVDVEKMDEDEFDALPPAEKRRLRGD